MVVMGFFLSIELTYCYITERRLHINKHVRVYKETNNTVKLWFYKNQFLTLCLPIYIVEIYLVTVIIVLLYIYIYI